MSLQELPGQPSGEDEAGPDGLYHVLYDLLRAHGHRPCLHLITADPMRGPRRAWLSAAGFGALGHSIAHAARLYVEAGATVATDPRLRADLQRLDRSLHPTG